MVLLMKSNNMFDDVTTNPENYNIRILNSSGETIAVFPLLETEMKKTPNDDIEFTHKGFKIIAPIGVYEKSITSFREVVEEIVT